MFYKSKTDPGKRLQCHDIIPQDRVRDRIDGYNTVHCDARSCLIITGRLQKLSNCIALSDPGIVDDW